MHGEDSQRSNVVKQSKTYIGAGLSVLLLLVLIPTNHTVLSHFIHRATLSCTNFSYAFALLGSHSLAAHSANKRHLVTTVYIRCIHSGRWTKRVEQSQPYLHRSKRSLVCDDSNNNKTASQCSLCQSALACSRVCLCACSCILFTCTVFIGFLRRCWFLPLPAQTQNRIDDSHDVVVSFVLVYRTWSRTLSLAQLSYVFGLPLLLCTQNRFSVLCML